MVLMVSHMVCIGIPQIYYSVQGVCGAYSVFMVPVVVYCFCTVSELSMVPMVSCIVLWSIRHCRTL